MQKKRCKILLYVKNYQLYFRRIRSFILAQMLGKDLKSPLAGMDDQNSQMKSLHSWSILNLSSLSTAWMSHL